MSTTTSTYIRRTEVVRSLSLPRPIPAHRMRRIGAFGIDLLVYFALTSLLSVVFTFIGGTIASLIYATLHDCTLGAGRSLGRAALGHRLMRVDGREVTPWIAMARNAIRWLMWSTVILFFVDLALLFFGEGRLLADHIMGTIVSEDPARAGLERREVVVERRVTEEPLAEEVDPELAAAHRELDFGAPHHAHDELRRFEDRLHHNAPAETVQRRR